MWWMVAFGVWWTIAFFWFDFDWSTIKIDWNMFKYWLRGSSVISVVQTVDSDKNVNNYIIYPDRQIYPDRHIYPYRTK